MAHQGFELDHIACAYDLALAIDDQFTPACDDQPHFAVMVVMLGRAATGRDVQDVAVERRLGKFLRWNQNPARNGLRRDVRGYETLCDHGESSLRSKDGQYDVDGSSYIRHLHGHGVSIGHGPVNKSLRVAQRIDLSSE